MAEQKHTLDEILNAIKDTGGIKQMIATRLGVHRNTVDNYLKRYATAQQAYDDEVAKVGDLAESVIIKALKAEDIEAAKWYARMKLKDRGYTERQEVTGKDGGPIAFSKELSKLSDEELEQLGAIVARLAHTGRN